MRVGLEVKMNIDISGPGLKEIIMAFTKAINPVFQALVNQAIAHFAGQYVKDGRMAKMVGSSRVTWKTATGKEKTSIVTPFGRIEVGQLQVKDQDTGGRRYITRLLLGIERGKRIPEITRRYIGLMGALAPLRVVNKFLKMFVGRTVSLMTIVRSIRDTADKISFGIDEKETGEFEADGTGLPILHAGKRGKELEVFAQRKRRGGIRIAGMTVSSYKKGWKGLFEPMKDTLKKMAKKLGSVFLVTDGDTSPLKGLDGIEVIVQRCLFHIPHEIKFTLWEDGVARKSKQWLHVLAKTLEITNVKRIYEDPGVARNVIKGKRNQLTRLIRYCSRRGYTKTVSFLTNAKSDMFTGIERRISGGTSSLIERVMRTINQRINISKWSQASALAVAKLRGAYYYNDFDI